MVYIGAEAWYWSTLLNGTDCSNSKLRGADLGEMCTVWQYWSQVRKSKQKRMLSVSSLVAVACPIGSNKLPLSKNERISEAQAYLLQMPPP